MSARTRERGRQRTHPRPGLPRPAGLPPRARTPSNRPPRAPHRPAHCEGVGVPHARSRSCGPRLAHRVAPAIGGPRPLAVGIVRLLVSAAQPRPGQGRTPPGTSRRAPNPPCRARTDRAKVTGNTETDGAFPPHRVFSRTDLPRLARTQGLCGSLSPEPRSLPHPKSGRPQTPQQPTL